LRSHRCDDDPNGNLNKPLVWALIGLFWLLVAVINVSQSAVSEYINDNTIGWSRHFILSIGWLIWFFLTPVVSWLPKSGHWNVIRGRKPCFSTWSSAWF
jgi:hypothetical protein